MKQFHAGDNVDWTSHTNRLRKATVITSLKARPQRYIVRITDGIPGERGQCRLVPPSRLMVSAD